MSKNIILDNTIDGDCGRVITWQFDNAEKLRGTILMFRDFFAASMKSIADKVKSIVDVAQSETIDDFALSIWGKLLGFDRPTVLVNGVLVPLLSSAYRKILVAKFKLLNSNASTSAYGAFLNEVFDGAVAISQNSNMALKFEYTGTVPSEGNIEEYHLYRLFCDNPDAIFIYPAGVKDDTKGDGPIFGFDGQWTLMDNGRPAVKDNRKKAKLIIENTSTNETRCRIRATVSSDETYPDYSVPVLALIVNGHEYRAVTWKGGYDFGSKSNPKTYSIVFDGVFHSGDVQVGNTLPVYSLPSPSSSSPTELPNISATVDNIEHYKSRQHDVLIPARSLFSGMNSGQRFYTLEDNIVQVRKRKAVYVYSDETVSGGTTSGTETSYYQYFSHPVDREAKEGTIIQGVERRGSYNNTISWDTVFDYSPFATIEPAGTGDFKVMNFDHGCFAWKRNIPLITQEQT